MSKGYRKLKEMSTADLGFSLDKVRGRSTRGASGESWLRPSTPHRSKKPWRRRIDEEWRGHIVQAAKKVISEKFDLSALDRHPEAA